MRVNLHTIDIGDDLDSDLCLNCGGYARHHGLKRSDGERNCLGEYFGTTYKTMDHDVLILFKRLYRKVKSLEKQVFELEHKR